MRKPVVCLGPLLSLSVQVPFHHYNQLMLSTSALVIKGCRNCELNHQPLTDTEAGSDFSKSAKSL